MKELVAEFMEEMRLKNMAKATIDSYQASANCFIRFLEEAKVNDFKEVTRETIQDYQKWLMEQSPRFSLDTVHLKLRGLRRFFEFLVMRHEILDNPADAIIYPKLGERLPKDILTRDEVKSILALPDINTSMGIRDRALLETLYSTGIRLAECTNLTVSDVDAQGGYLRVNQGKGGKDRIVPLGKIACHWLNEYIQKARLEFLKRKPADYENTALWVSVWGTKLLPSLIGGLVRGYGEKVVSNKKVTVHTWRRTLATHLLQEGVNPIYIQEILGHENTSSLSRYIKVAVLEVKQTHQKTHPRERVVINEEQ